MELFSTYTGPDFLTFYGFLLLGGLLAGFWIPSRLRPDGTPGVADGPEQAALIAGGSDRLAMTVLADLFASGAARPDGNHGLIVDQGATPATKTGRAFQQIGGRFDLPTAYKHIGPYVRQTEDALAAKGLMLGRGAYLSLRLYSVAPYVVLLALGWYRKQAGEAVGEPTGFLVGLMFLTLVLATVRWVKLSRLTRAGEAWLEDERERASRLQRAPTAPEVGLAVALFGTGVLVGTPFEPLHAMRQAAGDSGGGGDSSSDSGSGCGGGGCGGCGG